MLAIREQSLASNDTAMLSILDQFAILSRKMNKEEQSLEIEERASNIRLSSNQ